MSRCQKIQNLFSDYRTGILSPQKCRDVEAHISQCPKCAEELRVLDNVLALVERNTTDYEPPVGLWNGVYNRITQAQHTDSRAAIGRWLLQPLHAFGTAVAVAVLVAAIIVGGIQRNDTDYSVASHSRAEYIQGHVLYAAQAPLADRAGYLSLVVATSSEASDSQ